MCKKRLFQIGFCFLIFFFVVSCSNSEEPELDSLTIPSNEVTEKQEIEEPKDKDDDQTIFPDSIEGFERIESAGKYVYVGTDEITAKSNERPTMKVGFTYNFFVAKAEITCGEFNEVIKSVSKLKISCKNDSLPAADVTLFDAVLFANEKSKSYNNDSAYTYTKAIFDNNGHCIDLEGFSFRPQKNAFRLPTEAEWSYVAQTNWDVKNSWNLSNSQGESHKICSAGSLTRLCDIAGNVMEWVIDYLGNFSNDAMTDFVGAAQGDGISQRVIKGGSFLSASESMKIYSRGDTYAVTSSTHTNYVGFRLAFGAIKNPEWLDKSMQKVENRFVVLTNNVKVRSITGAYKSKLVFRNEVTGNLAYVDYTAGTPSVVEIKDNIDSYHPDISPDGNLVAFCTGLEGTNAKSSIYVRRLDSRGSNLVKLNVKNAAIPRWRVLSNGDTVIVYVTSAANNKDETSFLSNSTWQVKFSNGKFSTPKKLFDGAYHGGVSDDNRLAVSGSSILRARIDNADKVNNVQWYEGEQACNVSLSKDGSKRTIFLDFASKVGKNAVGFEYKTHEIIYVADSTGRLIQGILAPKPYSFDHVEWIYDVKERASGGVAVGTLVNADGAHTKIVLIDFEANEVTEILEGEDLWHPAMWSNSADNKAYGNLDIDSAGVYCIPNCGETPMLIRYKLELLWTHKDKANTILFGSSRMLEGAIPALFSDEFYVINMGQLPNLPYVSKYLYENYVIPHVKNLKYVVISLDLDVWAHSEHSTYNFFFEDYKNYPGFVYDINHSFWKDGYPEGLAEMTQAAIGSEFHARYFRDEMGYVRLDGNTWEENPVVEYDSAWMKRHPDTYYESLNHIEEIIEMSQKLGVYVVGVIFPQSPNFRKTGSFGKFGILRSEAPRLIADIASFSDKYPNFVLMDENKMGNHDYTDNMAQNKDHLGYPGAVQMTGRIDSVLKILEMKGPFK